MQIRTERYRELLTKECKHLKKPEIPEDLEESQEAMVSFSSHSINLKLVKCVYSSKYVDTERKSLENDQHRNWPGNRIDPLREAQIRIEQLYQIFL